LDIDNEWEGKYDRENAYGTASIITDGVLLTRTELSNGTVPNVKGMGAKDAVYLMEKNGLKVQLSGVGKVRSQSIPAGNRIVKGQTVRLTLK
jgi:cell division protein FtsI (penicillin-binding protein 3)